MRAAYDTHDPKADYISDALDVLWPALTDEEKAVLHGRTSEEILSLEVIQSSPDAKLALEKRVNDRDQEDNRTTTR